MSPEPLSPEDAVRITREVLKHTPSDTNAAIVATLWTVAAEAAFEPMDERWLREVLADAATMADGWHWARDWLSARSWGVAAQTLAALEKSSGPRHAGGGYAKRLKINGKPVLVLVRVPDVNFSPP